MEVMQGRYDYNFEILKREYNKVKGLELINAQNARKVYDYIHSAPFTTMNTSKYDLGKSEILAYFLNIVTAPFNYPSVRSEIRLLTRLNNEIDRVKSSNPGTYFETKRYKDIMGAIKELEICDTDKIDAIAFKYGFI